VSVVPGIAAAGLLLAGLPLLVVAAAGAPDPGGCVPAYDDTGAAITVPASPTLDAAGLDERQRGHAATVIAAGRSRGIPERGIVVALATALQESRLRVYANDGLGGDLAPDQQGIARSLGLPHEAVGTDHGSLGIFQQQWPWWGPMAELMDPATSAGLFYTALEDVPGWERLPVTVAAQAVQRSAYPSAYADDEPLARRLLADLGTGLLPVTITGVDCGALPSGGGTVTFPLPEGSGYVDRRNFGATGSSWASTHTGTDFSVACGTEVYAATNGTVAIRTDQRWAGPWLVKVATAPGKLTTWYAHLQRVDVTDGEYVTAGQVIGAVGQEGNASGCHLHFEVHPRGGSIYEDPVDPTRWLAENVGKPLAGAGGPAVTVMTANVPFTLPAARAREQLEHVLSAGAEIVALQEVHSRDLAQISEALHPSTWVVHQVPGGSALLWRRDTFTQVDAGSSLGFRGAAYSRWFAWATLRHRHSGATVTLVGLHLPPFPARDLRQRGYYTTMLARYRDLIKALRARGTTPIAAGDWNSVLDQTRVPWSPLRTNQALGMTSSWRLGTPCRGTRGPARFDGFALDPTEIRLLDQGCLPARHSDHRPVWIRVVPTARAS
jgi:hypothetical protein